MRWRGVLPAVVAVLVLVGCPVPIPPLGHSSTSRDNLPDRVPEFLVIGRTTRAEVLLALGAPDAHARDGGWFAYRSERHTGGVAFVVGGGGHLGAVGVIGYEERRLMVRFDDRSVVVDATFENRICPRGVVAADSGGGGESAACLKVSDLSDGPSPELVALVSLFVVKSESDTRDTHRLIVTELRRNGVEATSGPAHEAPPDADAILTYHDAWTGEVAPRMDQLGLLIVAPRSSKVLAKASVRQTPPAWKTPEQMVAALVTDIYTDPKARPFLTMPPYRPAPRPSWVAPPASGTVTIGPVRDARGGPTGRLIGERTALWARLGKIDMTPAPVAVVGQVLREELALMGHASIAKGGDVDIDAQLLKFEVRTPSSLTAWDVSGSIAVEVGVKRGNGTRQSFRYDANCTDRTDVDLSEGVIQAVVLKCLDILGAKVREDLALQRLLAGK